MQQARERVPQCSSLAGGIQPAFPFPAGPLNPAMMCDGAWEKAEDGMWFLQWEVATGIEECGDDGTPRPPSRRSYYPAPSPPARLVLRPKFSLSQAGAETLTTSTPPARTSQRASRVRRVARRMPTSPREWTTSRYSTRLRKECLTPWWTLLYQVWQISFENEVVTRSRELKVFYRDSGRRYPSRKEWQ